MWLYSKHVVLILLRCRRGNESVRNRFIDRCVHIKGKLFFLNQGLKNIGTLIINMVSFSYSDSFQKRLRSSWGGISFFGKLFLKFKGVKGVDVTGKKI